MNSSLSSSEKVEDIIGRSERFPKCLFVIAGIVEIGHGADMLVAESDIQGAGRFIVGVGGGFDQYQASAQVLDMVGGHGE